MFLFVIIHICVLSQNQGSLDLSFNPVDLGFGAGDGADYNVNDIEVQNNGKIIIVGNFTTYNKCNYNRICRLNPDGKPDSTFNIGSGANNSINSVIIQNDGKILIAGSFTIFNGVIKKNVTRLNSDGSLDPTFNVGLGPNMGINSVEIQVDGKIIIVGNFTSYNGVGRNYIARLNNDGSLDTSFDPGTGANGNIYNAIIQTDGKIICAGAFSQFNSQNFKNLVRLNVDGTIDNSISIGSGISGVLYDVQIQSDNKIIFSGNFSINNQYSIENICRVLPNGVIDTTFLISNPNSIVYKIKLQNDGKILIGGNFNQVDGISQLSLARLNINGSIDTTFNSGNILNSGVRSIQVLTNGKIIVGGYFFQTFEYPAQILGLDSNGNFDQLFNKRIGVKGLVYTVQNLPNDELIVCGNLNAYNGIERRGFFKTDPNGVYDTIYNLGPGINGHIMGSKIDTSDRLLIGGIFSTINNYSANNITRVKTNGTVDSLFDIGSGASSLVFDVDILQSGEIIVVGGFSSFDDEQYENIAKLYPYGHHTSFTQYDYNQWIRTTAIQQNGKILIGGLFTSINGLTKNRIARLNSQGELDNTFNIGTGANKPILDMVVQNDGKIILIGEFTNFNGSSKNRIVRIDSTGVIDNSFNIGTAADSTISAIFIQPDDKILIGGFFTHFNGGNTPFFVRLNPDGTIDTSFNTGSGPNDAVRAIVMQSDGKIIIGGHFTSYNGIGKNRLARINSNSFIEISTINDTTFCEGDTISIQINSTLNFDSSNIFKIGLTFFNGTIDTTILLSNIESSSSSSIKSVIPFGLFNGNTCKIFVKASNPALKSPFYIQVITINTKPDSPMISLQGSYLFSNIQDDNQWYNQYGPILGATNQNYFVNNNGVYYDIVIKSGCKSNRSNLVTINNVSIIDQSIEKFVKVYPNPFSEKIIIENQNYDKNIAINIYNCLGKKITESFLYDKLEINLSDYAGDLFILEIINDKKTEYIKLIKINN